VLLHYQSNSSIDTLKSATSHVNYKAKLIDSIGNPVVKPPHSAGMMGFSDYGKWNSTVPSLQTQSPSKLHVNHQFAECSNH
jgi:hypothetical protein